mgnify:CR=1 FL=1
MEEFWNSRYADKEYVYGTQPNAFFAAELLKLPLGKILLPAEGEGRNAVFAAKNGWKVHAFDSSIRAREKALALADSAGVNIQYQRIDIRAFGAKTGSFDLIGLVFAHFPPGPRKDYHQKLSRFLRKGGMVIMEAFAREQIEYNTGGPKNIDMLYSTEELKQDFSGLEILKLHQEEVMLDEGPFHRGKASVIRLLARK